MNNYMKIIIDSIKHWVNGKLTGKVDVENGKGLSTNDYTNEEKHKLAQVRRELAKTVKKSEYSWDNLPDRPFGQYEGEFTIANPEFYFSKIDETDGVYTYTGKFDSWGDLIEHTEYCVEDSNGNIHRWLYCYTDNSGSNCFDYYDDDLNAQIYITDIGDGYFKAEVKLDSDKEDSFYYSLNRIYYNEVWFETIYEEFIPDTIARVSDLNNMNVSWDNIQNKPFYSETSHIYNIPNTRVEFSEANESGVCTGTVFRPIDSFIPLYHGVHYSIFYCIDGQWWSTGGYAELADSNNNIAALKTTFRHNDSEIPATIYITSSNSFDVRVESADFSQMYMELEVYQVQSYTQTIPEYFIPDTIARVSDIGNVDWNNIQNRPFYEGTNFYIVVDYANISFSEADENGICTGVVTDTYQNLVEGANYQIYIDGQGHVATATWDGSYMHLTYDHYINDMYFPVDIVDNMDGSFSISITSADYSNRDIILDMRVMEPYIQTIPEHFIPDTIARKSDIEAIVRSYLESLT